MLQSIGSKRVRHDWAAEQQEASETRKTKTKWNSGSQGKTALQEEHSSSVPWADSSSEISNET